MKALSNRDIGGILFVVSIFVFVCVALFVDFKEKEKPKIQKETIIKETETPNNEEDKDYEIIGYSVEGRAIERYTFGLGDKEILFVGGIHGGYEWNSVLLAYEFIDYLKLNEDIIPENIKVTIIPSANPDGVYKVIKKEGRFELTDVPNEENTTGKGRFNAHNVDLNRNFDCKWQSESRWRGKVVDAGSAAFSEPESEVLRDFVLKKKPVAVIFWHSKSNAVYASECEDGVLPETLDIMNAYANSAGYKAVASFDAYPVTGDAEGWLASIGVPAITVELKTHEDTEFDKNILGVKALFDYYSNKQ